MNFKTLALSLGLSIGLASAAPILEQDFENFWNNSQGWTINDGSSGYGTSGGSFANTTSFMIMDGDRLISPSMNLSGVSSPTLDFMSAIYYGSCTIDVYYRGVSTDAWSLIQSISATTAYQHSQVSLPNPTSTYQVSLYTGAGINCYVDNVIIDSSNSVVVSAVDVQNRRAAYSISQPSNGSAGEIDVSLPYKSNVTALTPIFAGVFASLTPGNPIDFSKGPVLLTATAEDGQTTAQYNMSVTVRTADTASELTSLVGYYSDTTYDTAYSASVQQPAQAGDHGKVVFTLNYGSIIPNNFQVPPYPNLSEGATAIYSDNSWYWDFTGANQYTITVTAEDGIHQTIYDVSLVVASASTQSALTQVQLCDDNGWNCYTATPSSEPSNGNNGLVVLSLPYVTLGNYTKNISVTTSDFATSLLSISQPYSLAANDTFQVTVTAQDGVSKSTYNVVINMATPSSAAKLTTIGFDGPNGGWGESPTSNPSGTTHGKASFSFPYGFDFSQYPDLWVEVSDYATYTLSISTPYDFATVGTFQLTVTAQDGITKGIYDITINVAAPSSDATLYGVTFAAGDTNLTTKSINTPSSKSDTGTVVLTGFPGTDLSSVTLAGSNLGVGASLSSDPASGPFDFSNGNAIYLKVVAQDSSIQVYKVTASIATPSSATTLNYIEFASSTGYLNVSNMTAPTSASDTGSIVIEARVSTGISNISIASYTAANYATLTTDPSAPWDFTSLTSTNVIVTAQDGVTKSVYKVTVHMNPASTLASLNNLRICAANNCVSDSIITDPASSADTGVVIMSFPYSMQNAVLSINNIGVSNNAHSNTDGDLNFGANGTGLVIKVTAEDGMTIHYYKVVATFAAAPSTAAKLLQIELCNSSSGSCFSQDSIIASANDTSLVYVNIHKSSDSGSWALQNTSVSPWATDSTYGDLDFTGNGTGLGVTVTAEDGIAKSYYRVVMNTLPLDTIADLLGAELYSNNYDESVVGKVTVPATASTTGKIVINVPQGIDLSNWSLWPMSPSQYSSFTMSDGGSPYSWPDTSVHSRTITSTAEDGVTTRSYEIDLVFSDLSKSTALTWFELDNNNTYNWNMGTIDTVAHTVSVSLPAGSDISDYSFYLSAAPDATVNIGFYGDWSSVTSGQLTVTSPDGSASATYTVAVTIGATSSSSSSDIGSSSDTGSSSSSDISSSSDTGPVADPGSSSSSSSDNSSSSSESTNVTVAAQGQHSVISLNERMLSVMESGAQLRSIEIIDVKGHKVLQVTPTSSATMVNLQSLAHGHYYVKVSAQDHSPTVRAIDLN